jgi:CheY-like chemotaxis protein
MAGRLRVIVATPHGAEREVVADWLASDGLDPVRFSTSADAADDMRVHHFDLLITDFGFGFRDGLDVISRPHRRNPETPAIVIGESVAAQTQAELRGAMFLARPIDRGTLACTVALAVMDERPVRRSRRKPANRFNAVVEGLASHILDVSNEGLRLEVPNDGRDLSEFRVDVPLIGVELVVQQMWANARPDVERAGVAWYGGVLARNTSQAEQAWREFVEALPGFGGRPPSTPHSARR